jgi:hypothetical protein
VIGARGLWEFGNLRMIEERQELASLPEHVMHGLTGRTMRQNDVGHLIQPGIELSDGPPKNRIHRVLLTRAANPSLLDRR